MAESTVQDAEIVKAPEAVKLPDSPAKDLREIQALLVQGIFPGNVAPTIIRAFNTLEQMAQIVEKAANANQAK